MLGRAASDAAAIPRFRSLLVARHGKLVAENYFGGADSSTVFDLRSVTKSVVSMLTGIAIQSGQLPNIDATVGSYVDAPYALDANDRAVSVRQLLTMTSRYQWNESNGDDYNHWVLSGDHVQFLLDRRQTDPDGHVHLQLGGGESVGSGSAGRGRRTSAGVRGRGAVRADRDHERAMGSSSSRTW